MNEGFIVLVLIGVLVAFLVAPVLTPPPIAHFEILNPQESYVAPAIISVVSKTENVARLEWDFGDGTKVLNEKATTHTYCFDSDEARVFTIKLTVWDRFGRTSQASKDVTITPAPAPTIRAIQTNPPVAGVLEPLTVLRCSAEVEQWGGPDIVVNSYEWILMKRGSPNIVQKQTGKSVEFKLRPPSGDYDLILTVTNNACRKAVWHSQLRVGEVKRANIGSFIASPEQSDYYPAKVSISWTATHPQDSGPLRYSLDWDGEGGESPIYGTFSGSFSSEYTYTAPGTYNVILRVWSPELGMDESVAEARKTITIKPSTHFLMPAWAPAQPLGTTATTARIAFVFRDEQRPSYFEICVGTLKIVNDRVVPEFEYEPYFTLGTEGRATNLCPSWDAEGKRLVIMSDQNGQPSTTTDLYIISQKEVSTQLTYFNGSATAAFPFWTSKGDILFCSNENKLSPELYSIPATDFYIQELQRSPIPEITLKGPFDIYKLNPATGTKTAVVSFVAYNASWPAADPTNKWLAFELKGDIYVASLDGFNKDIGVIKSSPWRETYPRWNPKFNEWLAFMQYRDGRWQVVIYNIRTKEEARLETIVATDVAFPSWSTDGRYLICQIKKREGWRLAVWTVLDSTGKLKEVRDYVELIPVSKK